MSVSIQVLLNGGQVGHRLLDACLAGGAGSSVDYAE